MTTRRSEHSANATPGIRATGGALLPGKVIGEGRYRLLAQFGVDTRADAHFWRARDGQLRRDVALTVLIGNAGNREAAQAARRTLERATHAARFSHPAVSRVLDVLHVGAGIDPREGVLGIVVADWGPGTNLVDLIARQPLHPGMAARILEPLAAAVEAAHHAGLVLGVDHPQRIRVDPDGMLRLAFPGPLPDATLRDDVKGLGAILYLLLTGRWALRGGPPGLLGAPTGPDGNVLSPNVLQPRVPAELASAAVHILEDTSIGGIRTGAALLRVLNSVAELEAETERLVPLAEQQADEPDDGAVWTTRRPVKDQAKRRKLAIGVAILTVATVGVLAWLGMQLISFFSDSAGTPTAPPVVATVPQSQSQPSSPTSTVPVTQPAAAEGSPVKPEKVRVYAVKGDQDNAGKVNRIVDGNERTFWLTGTYKQQFPALKPGIGIMASFAEAVSLTEVVIDSPSAGTVVEIRDAEAANSKLADTTVLATATLTEGSTEIRLTAAEATRHVLIWITKLAGDGQRNVSQITEVRFVRAQ